MATIIKLNVGGRAFDMVEGQNHGEGKSVLKITHQLYYSANVIYVSVFRVVPRESHGSRA